MRIMRNAAFAIMTGLENMENRILTLDKLFSTSWEELAELSGKRDESLESLRRLHLVLRNYAETGGRFRELGEACGNCQEKTVYCGHADLGCVDYYDNFWHLCLNCFDSKHVEVHSSIGSETPDCMRCPYCSFDWR